MKVLIVDDDEMVRTVCSGMLTLLQHEVVAVSGGEAAIRTLQSSEEFPFDLILLDELMPGMSGPQTMQQMAYLGIRIPIILCSRREMTVEEFAGLDELRPSAVLGKPFRIHRLQAAMTAAIAQR